MPVKIGTFGPLSEAEFTELQQQKSRKTDPAMTALLAEIATGHPVRVPLVDGQSARGLRTAISRAAGSRGLSVETVEGGVRRGAKGRCAAHPEGEAGVGAEQAATAGAATQASRARRDRDHLRSKTWPLGRVRG